MTSTPTHEEITTADLPWTDEEIPELRDVKPPVFIIDPRLPDPTGPRGRRELAAFAPTGYLLDMIEDLPIEELDAEESLQAVVAVERIKAHADALQARLVARFADARPETMQNACSRYVPDELGLALGVSRHASGVKANIAYALTERLPATLAALQCGRIDAGKARKIADGTENITVEQAQEVERHVLQRAGHQSHSELGAAVDRAVIRKDPNGGRKRRQRRVRERKVTTQAMADGVTELAALLPSEVASACYDRVDQLAQKAKTPDDDRTADQRRADVFADLLLGSDEQGGVRAQIVVTVPYTSLLGVTDEPGELIGSGPLTAEVVREIAEHPNSVWRRLLTDPVSGVAMDLGRTRYRPTAGLDEFVRMRAQVCYFPGCRRPATRCDLDHLQAESEGGPTSEKNLGPGCRHHHGMRHAEGWTIRQPSPGIYEITTPTGRTYRTEPEPPCEPTDRAAGADDPPPF